MLSEKKTVVFLKEKIDHNMAMVERDAFPIAKFPDSLEMNITIFCFQKRILKDCSWKRSLILVSK